MQNYIYICTNKKKTKKPGQANENVQSHENKTTFGDTHN